jgi:hypothetical protein
METQEMDDQEFEKRAREILATGAILADVTEAATAESDLEAKHEREVARLVEMLKTGAVVA